MWFDANSSLHLPHWSSQPHCIWINNPKKKQIKEGKVCRANADSSYNSALRCKGWKDPTQLGLLRSIGSSLPYLLTPDVWGVSFIYMLDNVGDKMEYCGTLVCISLDTNLTENGSSFIACSLVAGETCPQLLYCCLFTELLLGNWSTCHNIYKMVDTLRWRHGVSV
jgi:hypothetical protein